MQRHLALLLYLFPLPKRRPPEAKEESADVRLDRVKRLMQETHARNRERAVIAITQKNNLQTQVEYLQKTIQNLQKKADKAFGRGDRELADQLLKEKQSYAQQLCSAEETWQQAVETSEQVKVAIKHEEEWLGQTMTEIVAFEKKWEGCAIHQGMQAQLERIGVWHLAQPPQPQIDRKTARELVGFLLLVIVGLLGWCLTALPACL
ncbi:PspA/IM30 family protein [Armatimonas sp.]|uniref:PspA/IM30 family protein n=1 Tax=Armatimonas sp. TaxID=1872638 RepID=UPI00375261CF